MKTSELRGLKKKMVSKLCKALNRATGKLFSQFSFQIIFFAMLDDYSRFDYSQARRERDENNDRH